MNIKTSSLAVLFSFFLLLSPLAAIDYISYVGAEVDSEAVLRYRSSAVAKTLTVNNGGIYATNGGINWVNGPSYIDVGYLNSLPQGTSPLQIDAIGGTADATGYCTTTQPAGYCNGTTSDGAQMVFKQSFSRVRVGVMWDIKGTTGDSQLLEMFGINFGDYTGSGTAISNSTVSTSSGEITMTSNATPDIYFFDLVNVNIGDVFNLLKGNTDSSVYVGAFLVDAVPYTSLNNGKWDISFTDNTASNFLNSQGGLTNPARSLKDTSGAWTAAVARLEGASAGTYDSLTVTGLVPMVDYYMNFQGAGGLETLKLVANAKGEITRALDAGFSGTTDLSVQMAWEQTAIYSVDFQSRDVVSMQDGNGDSILGLGDKWTIYDFNTWVGHGNANSLTDGYAKFLRDADGNDSQIYFSTEGNKIAGWYGDYGNDPLLRDYLFTGSGIHGDNPDFVSDPMTWEIGGLEAGDLYQLIMFGGAQRDAGIAVDGAIDGDDFRIVPTAGALSYWVYADATGTITGSFTAGTTNEGDWSGFHLLGYSPLEMSNVPEPSAWLMMISAILGGGGAIHSTQENGQVAII